MRAKNGVLLGLVGATAFLSGGWLLQRGASEAADVYARARMFDNVAHYVADFYVDSLGEAEIYDMAIDGLVADITEEVKNRNGSNVRVFQADSENYWYGFPPFTWIITPVISTVAADFEVPEGTPITEKTGG